MYSAITKRDDVFPKTVGVHFVGSQLKRNQAFTKKFVKRFLYPQLHVFHIGFHLHTIVPLTTRGVATELRLCVGQR